MENGINSLSEIIDSLDYLENAKSPDDFLKDRLEYITVSELIQVSLIRPDINDLKGTPTLALCKIIAYNKNYGMNYITAVREGTI